MIGFDVVSHREIDIFLRVFLSYSFLPPNETLQTDTVIKTPTFLRIVFDGKF